MSVLHLNPYPAPPPPHPQSRTWLMKHYHPAEFLAGVLTTGKGFYSPLVYTLECRRLGIGFLTLCCTGLAFGEISERDVDASAVVWRLSCPPLPAQLADGPPRQPTARRVGGTMASPWPCKGRRSASPIAAAPSA